MIARVAPQFCKLRYVVEANFGYKWPVEVITHLSNEEYEASFSVIYKQIVRDVSLLRLERMCIAFIGCKMW